MTWNSIDMSVMLSQVSATARNNLLPTVPEAGMRPTSPSATIVDVGDLVGATVEPKIGRNKGRWMVGLLLASVLQATSTAKRTPAARPRLYSGTPQQLAADGAHATGPGRRAGGCREGPGGTPRRHARD